MYFLNNFPVFINKNKITTLFGEREKRITYLAGFKEVKDHKNLIKAFKLVHNENSDWTLHLVGKLYNNNYTKEILKFIEFNQLEKHIFVYNECSDIQNILNQSTIGVLSSKSEGLPLAILEYGLAKLPVVTTDVGECKEVIENNISGFVVKKENIQELFIAINKLIKSSSKRVLFAENNYKSITQKYSDKSFLVKLLKYIKLIERNNTK